MSVHTPIHVLEDRHLLPLFARLPSFEEALARLLYVVEHRRPCGLVLGSAGTGKSALLKILLQELSVSEPTGNSCRPLSIDLGTAGCTDLPWVLATEMGLSPNRSARSESLWRSIEDRFQGAMMAGQPIIPIIDHLEQTDQAAAALSRCCHLALQFGSTVLLSARSPLGSSLANVVGPFCGLRIELPLWTLDETETFVSQALERQAPLRMTRDACAVIHACAGGRLRDTVQVLRLAVFAARAEGLDTIDADFLHGLAEEMWRPATQARTHLTVLPPPVELVAAHD